MPDISMPPDSTLLLAIAALLANQYQPSERDKKSVEVFLSEVGLSYREIAAIVGKQPDAVRVAISRSKAK
jgi:DNA-directed RNA polymerase specialized sigma24 family protein